jgi:DNA-binding response OmpR family regulator
MAVGQTILVVEDDEQWQAILRETLEDEGYAVLTIADFHHGRQALKDGAFDLAILDLELDRAAPTLEGERLLHLIARHYPHTPSIVVSGKGNMRTVRDAFKRYHVLDYIIKEQFDIPAFINAVEAALTTDVDQREIADAASSDLDEQKLQSIPKYETVLTIMQNMAQVMERSPQAFTNMNEEDLRHHFLVQLNGYFAGNATGETFNYSGKTDILIRVNGRNVFIAECKFWRGPKGLTATIDQLLGYVNWRDTKTAILLFNRGRPFSHVLARIPEVVASHPCFKREAGVADETVFRYVFHRTDDPDRELLLTVLAFDIPT